MSRIVITGGTPTARERRRWLAYREDMAPHRAAFAAAREREWQEMNRRLQPALEAYNAARAELRHKYRLPPGEPGTLRSFPKPAP